MQEWLGREREEGFGALRAAGYGGMAGEPAAIIADYLHLQMAAAEGNWRWDD